MNERSEIIKELLSVLSRYKEEIAASWAERIHLAAGSQDGDLSRAEILTSTLRGVGALIEALRTSSFATLEDPSGEDWLVRVQKRFENGGVSGALLLCKEAALPFIVSAYPQDAPLAWAMVSELDDCLLQMAGQLNTLSAAEMSRQLKDQHARMVLMLKVVQQATSFLEMDSVLRSVASGIMAAAGVDHCVYYLVSEDQHQVILRRGIGAFPTLPIPVDPILDQPLDPVYEAFIRQVLEQKRPLASNDVQADPRVNQPVARALGFKSVLAVPLVVHDRVLALAMTGTVSDYHPFTEEQIELAGGIASAAALAIENARLYEESRKQQAENQGIQRVTSALLQELDLKEVLEIVCLEAQQMTGARGSAVYFLESAEELQCVFNTGEEPTFERVPLEGSLGGTALREGKPILMNDPAGERRVFRREASPLNLLVVPLMAKEDKIGTLYMVNKPGGFTPNDLRSICIFADQAAIAIKNARLHQQMRYLAALEERDRLAREMHDNVAQSLSALKLQASFIGELLRNGQIEQAQKQLAELTQAATEAHTDVREAIFSLHNSASNDAEFLPTLQAYLERYQKSYGIKAHLSVQQGTVISLSPKAVVQMTRIIQEALTNVRKHAQAHTAWVRLEQKGDLLTITVEDDGQGFDPAAIFERDRDSGGVGLQVMRERAQSIGGDLQIDARPGRGTRIVAWTPLSTKDEKEYGAFARIAG